jgi:hypothetical protein
VRRASVLLLQAGPGAIPTAYGGAAICAWSQSQLDPSHDGDFKQNDVVYLLNALAKKYRFVESIANSSLVAGTSAAFSVSVQLYNEASGAVTAQTEVSFEVATSAGMPSLSVTQGTQGTSVGGNLVLAAHAVDGSYGASLSPGGSAWPVGGALELAFMVQTRDSLGNTEVLRRIPFFGSGVTEYAEQGFSFDPVVSVEVVAGGPTTAAPTTTPTPSPTTGAHTHPPHPHTSTH